MDIDSDGIVNGQVLVSDVENITELTIEPGSWITNLTGIEAFTSLESLVIMYNQITSLDLSHNTRLKSLNCRSNSLSSIDISSNPLLEELHIGNDGDFGPFNDITHLDLSHNPNIRYIEISNLAANMDWINLKNGNNNQEMEMYFGFSFPFPENTHVICIQVDDADLATNNQYPYSEWNISSYDAHYNFSESCAMSVREPDKRSEVYAYPNPAFDIVYIKSPDGSILQSVELYDTLGRLVMHYKNVGDNGLDVSGLAKGMYLLKILNGTTMVSQKIIVE